MSGSNYRLHGIPSEKDIYTMYLAEGKSPEEAKRLSKDVYRAMNTLHVKEKRFWKKVHEHEVPSGLDLGE